MHSQLRALPPRQPPLRPNHQFRQASLVPWGSDDALHRGFVMFTSAAGPQSRCEGVLHRTGVDVGFTQESVLGWAVFAPMHRIGPSRDVTGCDHRCRGGGLAAMPMRWWEARIIFSRFNR